MKSFGAIVIAYVAICFVQGLPGDKDGPKGHSHGMNCAGSNLTIPEAIKTAVETCMNKTKSSDDKALKSCGIICAGTALGMLDASGKPVKDKVTAGLKDIFPAAALKDITTEVTTCIDQNEKSLVLKDGDCSSYNEMVECGMKGIMKVCMPK